MAEELLPPGLTPEALRTALRSFAAVVGADNVFVEAADRHAYSDKFAVDERRHVPLGAVAPLTAEEVQAVVRIANETRVRCGRSAAARTSATARRRRCSPVR